MPNYFGLEGKEKLNDFCFILLPYGCSLDSMAAGKVTLAAML